MSFSRTPHHGVIFTGLCSFSIHLKKFDVPICRGKGSVGSDAVQSLYMVTKVLIYTDHNHKPPPSTLHNTYYQ
jgi:hypothetical protein